MLDILTSIRRFAAGGVVNIEMAPNAKSECDCSDLYDKHRSMAAMERDALRPLLADETVRHFRENGRSTALTTHCRPSCSLWGYHSSAELLCNGPAQVSASDLRQRLAAIL